MRILQLGPYPPPHGGVQSNIVAIRNCLRERGDTCFVINITGIRRPDDDDVYYPANAWQVLRLLRTLPYDLVHLHLGGNLTARLLGLQLVCALIPGKKSALTFHSGGYPSSPEGKSARYATLRGFVFRKLDAIITVNQELVDVFLRFGVRRERLHFIYPHVLPSSPVAALDGKLHTFFEKHDPVLITVGLLEPEYDLPLQIDILEDIRQRYPRAGLLIAGSGSLQADLDRHIGSKAYAGDVLLYGDIPHAQTLTAIRRSSMLLRTTLYDGDSVAVREALHLGTPVIATDNQMRPPGVRLIPISNRERLKEAIFDELAQPVRERNDDSKGNTENAAQVVELYRRLNMSR